LPSLGAATVRGAFSPAAAEESPFPFLEALLNLIRVLAKKNYLITKDECFRKWVDCLHPYYEKIISSRDLSLRFSWFSGPELGFLTQLVLLGTPDSRLPPLVLSLLQTKHVHLSKDIFNNIFEVAEGSLEGRLSQLNIRKDEDEQVTKEDVLKIRDMYSSMVLPHSNVKGGTLTERNSGEPLLATDWIFQPIIIMYNEELAAGHIDGEEVDLPAAAKAEKENLQLKKLDLCLQWVSLELSTKSSLSPTESGLLLSRLLLTFVLDCSPFLHSSTAVRLQMCLTHLCQASSGRFNLSSVPGLLSSPKELYGRILEEYAASSYGNALFAMAALLPSLAGPELASVLWLDHAEDLSMFNVTSQDLPAPLNVQSFVVQSANDDIIEAMVRAVASGAVDAKRNPLLFAIAKENITVTQKSPRILGHIEVLKQKGLLPADYL